MDGVALYNDQSVIELADSAAESIRGINHLTLNTSSARYPSEVYRTLGCLTVMAERLPQVWQQPDHLLQAWLDADEVTAGDGEFSGDPVAAVTTASVYLLEQAAPAAVQLREAFERTQAAIAFASFAGPDTEA